MSMNIDSDRGIDVLRTEPVRANGRVSTFHCSVSAGGFPEAGGSSTARQDGDQYTFRCRKTDYPLPLVHDILHTDNYGSLEVKERFSEGNYWALRVTGKVKGRTDL